MKSAKSRAFEAINYARYKYLFCLMVKKEVSSSGGIIVNLEVGLRETIEDEIPALRLTFYNVVDLKIANLTGVWAITLEKRDIASWNREKINYRFVDSESNCLQFDCEDFDFSIKTDPL